MRARTVRVHDGRLSLQEGTSCRVVISQHSHPYLPVHPLSRSLCVQLHLELEGRGNAAQDDEGRRDFLSCGLSFTSPTTAHASGTANGALYCNSPQRCAEPRLTDCETLGRPFTRLRSTLGSGLTRSCRSASTACSYGCGGGERGRHGHHKDGRLLLCLCLGGRRSSSWS